MKKYNMEKVLYFADQEKGLHVSFKEGEIDSDLSKLVMQALSKRYIKQAGDDDSGCYYQTTRIGKKRLLELQIQWRKNNGKCALEKSAQLDALRGSSDGEGVEPVPAVGEATGFDLRDWFAGQALLGLTVSNPHVSIETVTADAYLMADAMLEARSK